jgi:hypothetical protein
MSVYVITNELAEQNYALVKDAGITDVYNAHGFVTVIFEDFDFMILGRRAKLKNNTLRIERFRQQFKTPDILDIDLTKAQFLHLELWDAVPNIKPQHRLPCGFAPLRPIVGVRFSVAEEE